MTDKERILFKIIQSLANNYILAKPILSDGVCYGFNNSLIEDPLEPGMLVICRTGYIHDWSVGILVEKINDGWVLKELDSDRLCNVTNEAFIPINGMSFESLLHGEDYAFYKKILKAFRRGNKWSYRYGGIDILTKRKWRLWIREVFCGHVNGSCKDSKPFYVDIQWTKNISIKAILQQMIDGGYGTHVFEKVE